MTADTGRKLELAPVPAVAAGGAVPAAAGAAPSVFDDFLSKARAHERMGGVVSPFLFKTALWADAFLLAVVLVGWQLDPDGVRRSGFFLVGGGVVASVIGFLHLVAWPLLAIAVVGLAVKLWRRNQRTHESVHVLCAVESVAAVAAGLGWFAVLVMFVIELVIWIVLIALMVALMIAVLGAVIAAAGS